MYKFELNSKSLQAYLFNYITFFIKPIIKYDKDNELVKNFKKMQVN